MSGLMQKVLVGMVRVKVVCVPISVESSLLYLRAYFKMIHLDLLKLCKKNYLSS